MGAETKGSKKLLQELMAHAPKDAGQTIRKLRDHTDDATVLIAAQLLSDALEATILKVCRPGFGKYEREGLFNEDKGAPVATFSSRIRIAYALSCIGPQTRDDLNTVRKIRNAFAHARQHISFRTPPIPALCRDMHVWAHDPTVQTHENIKEIFVFAVMEMHTWIEEFQPLQYRLFDVHKWAAVKSADRPWPQLYEAFRVRPRRHPLLGPLTDGSPPP